MKGKLEMKYFRRRRGYRDGPAKQRGETRDNRERRIVLKYSICDEDAIVCARVLLMFVARVRASVLSGDWLAKSGISRSLL